MSKIKRVLQHDETDCGAACISIILKYYGKTVPLRRIRTACGTDSVGTSGYGIVKGAERFGLSSKGLMSPEKDKIYDSGGSNTSSTTSSRPSNKPTFVATSSYGGYLVPPSLVSGKNSGNSGKTDTSSNNTSTENNGPVFVSSGTEAGNDSTSNSCSAEVCVKASTYSNTNHGGGSSGSPKINNDVPSTGGGCSGIKKPEEGTAISAANIAIQERLKWALRSIGFKSYIKSENPAKEYRCDQYVAEVLEKSGFNVEKYCVDDPAGKNVDTHVQDMIATGLDFKTFRKDLENGGSYIVFMVDQNHELDSHVGLYLNGGLEGCCFIDDSQSNYDGRGGSEFHYGKNINEVFADYRRYEYMYFVPLK